MKKIIKIAFVSVICAVCAAVGGCKPSATRKPDPVPSPPTFTPHESAAGIEPRFADESEIIVDFAKGASSAFHWADGYTNGGTFNCYWRKNNASIENGVMSMTLSGQNNLYYGAEYRSRGTYSYGFYAVKMKAAKCSGVISSFFTYTNTPVWDEIDIEFLGKDTGKIQFNYFTKGSDAGHTFLFELGFDASEDFHEYAFDWQPESITWYVDGTAVYRATENIPSHAMQLMANVWNCRGADEWSGKFDASPLPVTAEYEWFAYGG